MNSKDQKKLPPFTEVDVPHHLSIDSEGRVLVADYHNDRILLLSSQLEQLCVLIDNTHSQVRMSCPYRLSYSELTSELYVVHRRKGWLQPHNVISLFNVH